MHSFHRNAIDDFHNILPHLGPLSMQCAKQQNRNFPDGYRQVFVNVVRQNQRDKIDAQQRQALEWNTAQRSEYAPHKRLTKYMRFLWHVFCSLPMYCLRAHARHTPALRTKIEHLLLFFL